MTALAGRRLRVLLVLLAGASGCAGPHSRPWGYPNGFSRRVDTVKGWGRLGKSRAPRVQLRMEDAPESSEKRDGAVADPLSVRPVLKTIGNG